MYGISTVYPLCTGPIGRHWDPGRILGDINSNRWDSISTLLGVLAVYWFYIGCWDTAVEYFESGSGSMVNWN